MSYSRFGDSYWYTYWSTVPEGITEDRDTAIFEVCTVTQFSAKQLRDDVDACIAEAVELAPKFNWVTGEPSEQDIQELRDCIAEFLADVDREYPSPLASH